MTLSVLSRRLVVAGASTAALAGGVSVAVLDGGDDRATARAAAAPPAVSAVRVPDTRAQARVALRRELGAGAVVSTDARTGGVRVLARPGHPLTGPARGGSRHVALAFVRRHGAVFGLDRADLRALRPAGVVRATGGLRSVRFTQQAHGVPFVDGQLRALVDRRGRLLQVDGGARHGVGDVGVRPRLGAAVAAARAAAATGGPAPHVVQDGARLAKLADGGHVELVVASAGGLRLAWRVTRPQGDRYYDQLIDARTGVELRRTDRADAATATAYGLYPGAAHGGDAEAVDLSSWMVGGSKLDDGRVHVFTDLNGDDQPSPDEEVGPDSDGNWAWPRVPVSGSGCPVAGCSWTPYDDGGRTVNRRHSATQAYVTISRFLDRLAAPPISFSLGDEMTVEDMAGAEGPGGVPSKLNNATLWTGKQGWGTEMHLYLWGSSRVAIPKTDSADDATVVEHEVVHGMTGRLVSDGDGWSALTMHQPGAIGEALSDFYALDDLVDRGLIDDTGADGEVVMAPHVSPNRISARTEPIDCPVGSAAAACQRPGGGGSGWTYADFGKVIGRPEVHADGEIMAQTLWDLRGRLIARMGQGAGVTRMLTVLTNALRVATPAEPTFLDLRNALLQADESFFGADRDDVWAAFAGRGMGLHASTPGPDSLDVKVDATDPATAGQVTTLSGTVRDRVSGNPLKDMAVTLAGPEQGRDALTTTTDAAGRYRLDAPAGSYPYAIVRGVGYERTVVNGVNVADGSTRDFALRRNWADTRLDAEADLTGEALARFDRDCPIERVADGDHASGVLLKASPAPSITITLAQDVDVTSFALDPHPACSGGPDDQLRGYRIEVAKAAAGSQLPTGWTDVADGTFGPEAGHGPHEIRPSGQLEGVRYVRLIAIPGTDASGKPQQAISLSDLQVFAVPKTPPRAAFDHDPSVLRVDVPTTLTARRPADGEPPIVRYQWDLDGDGEFETDGGSSPNIGTTFTETGDHAVGLRVTDGDGDTDETTKVLHVGTFTAISELGVLDGTGDTESRPNNIGADGTVVGESFGPTSGQHPFRFAEGMMSPLNLDGAKAGNAYDSRSDGSTVGTVLVGQDLHAVRWNADGTRTDLGGLVPPPSGSATIHDAEALATNEVGDVAGYASDATGRYRPTVTSAGHPIDDVLTAGAVPDSDTETGKTMNINSAGVAVGCLRFEYNLCLGAPFVSDHGTFTKLPVLPGDQGGGASGINLDGIAVGGSLQPVKPGQPIVHHAVRWLADHTVQRLDDGNALNSIANDINDQGHIVGVADDRAVWWHDGRFEDLNRYVKGTKWTLTRAAAINDRDQIAGEGTYDGHVRAFELDLGGCTVCVSGIQVLERDPLATGTWRDAGDDGSVDGNLVKLRVTVHNSDPHDHLVKVKLLDQVSGGDEQQIEAPSTDPAVVAVEAGRDATYELEWQLKDAAWGKDGRPTADHLVSAELSMGRLTLDRGGTDLLVRPKPVVLVHGMNAEWSSWKAWPAFVRRANADWHAFAVGDQQAPGVMDTGTMSNPWHKPNGIPLNASILQGYLDAVREQEGAEHVDLVAHSMGGLISRYYIDKLMPDPAGGEPVVSHLLQMGTPNEGSPCANQVTTPMSVELRTDNMALFNAEITNRKDVPFSIFAGTLIPMPCFAPGQLGDVIVPKASALWEIQDRTESPLTHHMAMTGSAEIFKDYALPRLDGLIGVPTAPADGLRATTRSATAKAGATTTSPAFEADPQQLLTDARVDVPAGKEVAVPLQVDAGTALDVTLVAAGDVSATLLDPDGVERDTAAASADGVPFRGLSASNPASGTWTVVLHGGDADRHAEVSSRVEDDPWKLDVRTGTPGPDGRLPVSVVVARDAERQAGATVTVAAQAPLGDPQAPVTLVDDGAHDDGAAGDGCYAGTVPAPTGAALLTATAEAGGVRRTTLTGARVPAPTAGAEPATCPAPPRKALDLAYDTDAFPEGHATVGEDGVEHVLTGLPASAADATWSPDGTRVAYVDGASLDKELVVADADGGNPRVVVPPGRGWLRAPRWSPDGSRLAFTGGCDLLGLGDGCGIWQVPVAGGEPKRVTPLGENASLATWSPDGRRIAYGADVWDAGVYCPPVFSQSICTSGSDIFTVRLDGTGERRLTSDGHSAMPAWSPDGDRIAVVRVRGVGWRGRDQVGIDTIAPDGTGRRDVSGPGGCHDGDCSGRIADVPVWAPDGRRLAWLSGATDTALVVAGRDGSGQRELLAANGWRSGLTWRVVPDHAVQHVPSCQDAEVTVERDGAATLGLTCTDLDGDPLTRTIVDGPAHGTAETPDAGGAFRYTPAAGFMGVDQIRFRASDHDGASGIATLTIHVIDHPPAPTCQPAEAETARDHAAIDVALRCTSATGDTLSYALKGAPGHGTAEVRADRSTATYKPAAGFLGDDRFTITATDRHGTSAPATITIHVREPVAPPPPPVDPPGAGGGVKHLPSTCPVDPRTNSCVVEVGCHAGGSNCTGQLGAPLPGARTAAVTKVKAIKMDGRLVKPLRFTLAAGHTRELRVALTKAGAKRLRATGRLRVKLVLDLRQGGEVVLHSVRTVTFRRTVKKQQAPRKPTTQAKPRAAVAARPLACAPTHVGWPSACEGQPTQIRG